MTTAIELHRSPFDPSNIDEAMKLATTLAKSSLVPITFRGKDADVLLVIMCGRELGLSVVQSFRAFYVLNGKIAMYADAMIGVVVGKPVCKYFRLVESTDKQATYETVREGSPAPVKMTYTFDQAKRAGLTGNQTYQKHTEAMLRARCASALARVVYPDLLAGIYDPSELEEVEAPKPETPQELQARVSAMVKANHEAVMGKPPPPVPTAESSSGRTVAFEADNAGSNPASATLTPGSSSGRNAGPEPVNGGSNPSPGTNPFQSDPEFAPADRATTLHRDQLMNFKFASGPRKGQFVSSAALTDLLQMRDYFRDLESKKPEPDSKSLGNKQLLEALTFHADLKEAAKHEAEMGALAHQTSAEAAQ